MHPSDGSPAFGQPDLDRLRKLSEDPGSSAAELQAVLDGITRLLVEFPDSWEVDWFGPRIRFEVARHPAAGPLLPVLASDSDRRVRVAVAGHRHTPPDLVAVLAYDPDPGVRATISRRTDLDAELVERLSRDPVPVVRFPGPNATVEQLRRLAVDIDRDVKAQVALHPGTPPDVLEVLLASPEERVRENARLNRNAPRPVELPEAERRLYAAGHPAGPCDFCTRRAVIAGELRHSGGAFDYHACAEHVEPPEPGLRCQAILAMWTGAGWMFPEDAYARPSLNGLKERPDTVYRPRQVFTQALAGILPATAH